jgi:hypothetical protein
MKALLKVEKNGIIPIEALGVNEGDIIQIEKVYISKKDKKKLFSNKKAIYHVEASEARCIGRLRAQ